MRTLLIAALSVASASYGVETYSLGEMPSEYRVSSKIKFAGYPHDGFRFKGKMTGKPYSQDAYELNGESLYAGLGPGSELESYRQTDGTYFAIPVTGAASKAEIQPVCQLLTARADMITGLEVWTDEEMRDILMRDVTSAWETHVDEWDNRCENEYHDLRTMVSYYRGWDNSLWPGKKSNPDRYWVFVKLNDFKYLNSTEWGGDYTFRIGLKGTSEWSPSMHISIMNVAGVRDSDGMLKYVRGYQSVRYDDIHNGYDPYSFAERVFASGTFPVSITMNLPGPGTLYLYGSDYPDEDDSISKEKLQVSGSYIQADNEWYYGMDEYSINPYWPAENLCAYAGSRVLRAIVVDGSGGTTLQLRAKEEMSSELDISRIQFFPQGKKSVAIEATWGELATWQSSMSELKFVNVVRGKVSGTGVYSAGDHVRLQASSPRSGEKFVRWEVLLNELPEGLDLTRQTLEFDMPEGLCGYPSERRQIVVRPVWEKLNAVTALPNVPERGTVTGSGSYPNGKKVTLTAVPATGYVFTGWSDGETSATRSLQVVDSDDEHVLYACFNSLEELSYNVVYRSAGQKDVVRTYVRGNVFGLPRGIFTSSTQRLVGWDCSNGKLYDDGVLVFNLANPGETVTMTAIWE